MPSFAAGNLRKRSVLAQMDGVGGNDSSADDSSSDDGGDGEDAGGSGRKRKKAALSEADREMLEGMGDADGDEGDEIAGGKVKSLIGRRIVLLFI